MPTVAAWSTFAASIAYHAGERNHQGAQWVQGPV